LRFDDHRELHGDGFADAAGAGLPDEEIGQVHVVGNLAGETLDEAGRGGRQAAKRRGELLVVPADEDELRRGQPPRDFEHDIRALSPEQHQTRGTQRIETQPRALRGAVDRDGFVKPGAEDHAGCEKHAIGRVAKRGGLRGGFPGAANQILFLNPGAEGLHPKMRGIIGEIG
jgi:hypothetical protein